MAKKKALLILLCISISVFCCGIIYGMSSVSVTNYFETGIVDIGLKEYQTDGVIEIPWQDNPTILPGDSISKIPRIHNYGNDCYVRAKITFRDTEDLGFYSLGGLSNKWVLAEDGYFYYKEILPHGEEVDIFQSVNIPDDFPQENAGKQFYIDIDVDAIQSKNFTPDFSLALPWGNVQILMNDNTKEYDVSKFKASDSKTFQIVYQGDAEKLISNSKDFFLNIPYLMPGDTYSDTVVLKNDGKDAIKLYFRSASKDEDILRKIQLTIYTEIDGDKKTVYTGNLLAKDLAEDVVLGELKSKSEGKFHFEIHIPAELNNKYNLAACSVQWIFSTDLTKDPDSPKTGDMTHFHQYLFVMILAFAAMIAFAVLLYKERKEEEKNGKKSPELHKK